LFAHSHKRDNERTYPLKGGPYADPKLEAFIGKIVERLVAASERPDLSYKVTILNSGAVMHSRCQPANFTSRAVLIALASDTSELSSYCP